MKSEFPYIVRDTCFGNKYDKGANGKVSYNLWHEGDCIILNWDELLHLQKTITEIVEFENANAGKKEGDEK